MISSFCRFSLAALLALPCTLTAQNLSTDVAPRGAASEQAGADVEEWVKELSNLPAEKRAEYTEAFSRAKHAYTVGRYAECEAFLNTCEFYTRKSPHVWNLRAGALIAQQRFEEARPLLENVLKNNPKDEVGCLSLSLLYLGMAEYEKCLEVTETLLAEIRYKKMEQLTHSLMFRKVLCYMMLGRESDAREVVKDIGPIDDSPLYYYSQAVFFLAKGDTRSAKRDFSAADMIYGSTGHLSGYKQALSFSGVVERYAALGK